MLSRCTAELVGMAKAAAAAATVALQAAAAILGRKRVKLLVYEPLSY
jgi:hypothetical protein